MGTRRGVCSRFTFYVSRSNMTPTTEKSTRLVMLRRDLEEIPEFPVPAGFTLRWYQPGDEASWLNIHRLADHYNEISPELFAQQFGNDTLQLRQRQCFLFDPSGHAIGTASAWFDDNFDGGRIGRVHWVALVPQYQGRKLSKPLMTTICRRLRELGHERGYLTTIAARKPAIELYLRFGFVPLIRNELDHAIWSEVIQPE